METPLPGATIRVAILKSPSFSLKGMDLIVKDSAGRPVPLPDAYDEIKVSVSKDRSHILLGSREVEGEPLTIESPGVYFRIAGRQYREKVSVYREGEKLLAVNAIELEDYLVGLINHEISSAWPIEAVEAQAVVARTYALYQAGNSRDPRYDLESTVEDQVYGGSQVEDYASAKAVRETAGQVLVDDEGAPVQAFYCSSCGGITELPQNVWGMATPLKKSVKDPWCEGSPGATWTLSVGAEELGAKLAAAGYPGGTVSSISVLKRSAADRAVAIRIEASDGETKIGGNELRRVIGYDKLKSARFTVKKSGESFLFQGRGNGHGVGLCQWGARGMATAGYSYRQILGFYYPGLYLRSMDKIQLRQASR